MTANLAVRMWRRLSDRHALHHTQFPTENASRYSISSLNLGAGTAVLQNPMWTLTDADDELHVSTTDIPFCALPLYPPPTLSFQITTDTLISPTAFTISTGVHAPSGGRLEWPDLFQRDSRVTLTRRIPGDIPKNLQVASTAALRRLRDLASLPNDWDGYGANRLSQAAVHRARGLILDAVEACWHEASIDGVPSFIAPIADGGVQLEWDGPGGHLEVEVTPQTSLDYLLVQDGAPDRVFEERHGVSRQSVLTLVARVLGSPADG